MYRPLEMQELRSYAVPQEIKDFSIAVLGKKRRQKKPKFKYAINIRID